jgi:peptidase E
MATADPAVRTIFAMGGGGFTMEPDNPVLDEFILGLSPRREPRICFLPTASGDPDAHIARFYAAYRDLPCEPAHISLFRLGAMPRTPPLRELLLSQDIVYVGGGSMRNMLAIWQVHGLDAILREAWERGVVLAGLSAGAMCWFEGGITKSTGEPEVAAGLGLLPGSFTVHADGEPDRLPVYLEAVRTGALPAGWAADDGVGLVMRGARLERVVGSRPAARLYRVERAGDDVLCTPRLPELLQAPERGLRPVPADVREFREARYGASRRG